MASPNAVFTELVSTTFRKHRKEVVDNVTNHNALCRRLMKKGQHRREDGGLTIACPLDYAENGTYQRYSGFDILDISASDVISAAEYQWRQIAINVVADGRTLRINSGGPRIINLVKARIKNAMRTFKNNFSVDLYSDGTLSNQINGLQALISDAGTGTVGGINSTTFSFWQNQVETAAATLTASNIEGEMLDLYLKCVRGDDQPDLILTSNEFYKLYENSQTSLKRYNTDDSVSGGFVAIKYKKADVIFDGGSGIPAAHMYFINTDYLELVAHTQADLTVMDEMKPYNQDAAVVPILWMGNLVCTNRARQGVLLDA